MARVAKQATAEARHVREKLAELGHNLELWRVHIDELHEQEKNARVMDPRTFDRLTANISKGGRLEQLPFCALRAGEIEVVSGHHRIRAARAAELMEVFVLVDTSGLSSMEEILVASVITRTVLDSYANVYLDDRDRFAGLPPTLVALEEAQRVLSRVARSDENVFPRVAREGRKFKVGLCAVSQQPKLIDDELLSQFNTFFILGLADEKDRNILRGSSKQDVSDLGPEIQTLMPGEAIVTNLEAPFALPAQIYLYEEYLKSVSGPSPLPPRPEGASAGFAE